MVVGNAPEAADMVVIGAGPGGYTAALHASKRGRDVTLIDRGGEPVSYTHLTLPTKA